MMVIDATMEADVLGELENIVDEYCCEGNNIDGSVINGIIDMVVSKAFSPDDLTSNELHHLMLACDVIVGWHDGDECPYHDNGEEDDEDNCEIVRHNVSQFKAMLGA